MVSSTMINGWCKYIPVVFNGCAGGAIKRDTIKPDIHGQNTHGMTSKHNGNGRGDDE